jgi:hypothetical protein
MELDFPDLQLKHAVEAELFMLYFPASQKLQTEFDELDVNFPEGHT